MQRQEVLAKATILLVEDEVLIAMASKQTLERHGYQVIIASSGEQAVQIVENTPELDLILMDIDLGSEMSGTDAAEIILAQRDIALTFLSSHTEPEIVNMTDGITAYGYVVKNSGETVLLASIKMALRLHQSEGRFRRVMSDVSEVAIQGYAQDGTTNYWNLASELLYGYSAKEAIGKKLWDLIIPQEMASAVQQAVQQMIARGEANPPETLSLQHKDGSRVLVRSNHSLTMNARGEPELFCLDIPV